MEVREIAPGAVAGGGHGKAGPQDASSDRGVRGDEFVVRD
jgi:hypothetical protein